MSATKGTTLGLALCGLIASAPACKRAPDPALGQICAADGIVSSRRAASSSGIVGSEVAVEIVQSGCASCAETLRPGAAPGSACGAPSVCAESCCACPSSVSSGRYRARVCENGRCAAAGRACPIARSTIAPDVCVGH